jgi:hypothetical protein
MKTDAQVQEDVTAELWWESAVDSTHVRVEVRNGVVTLAGCVNDSVERRAAERAARRITGVRALTVDIQVMNTDGVVRVDADAARSAQNVSQWLTYLPEDCVRAMVDDGWDRTV